MSNWVKYQKNRFQLAYEIEEKSENSELEIELSESGSEPEISYRNFRPEQGESSNTQPTGPSHPVKDEPTNQEQYIPTDSRERKRRTPTENWKYPEMYKPKVNPGTPT